MTFYKAFKPGTCALRERPGNTPLQGYVGKGQLFEYIEGTPLPTSFAREWLIEHDHDGNVIDKGPAPERKAGLTVTPVVNAPAVAPTPSTPTAVADRMAKARAARKSKNAEPAAAGG